MFDRRFPEHWTTNRKLIWLIGAVAQGASAVWKTVTGTLIHITDALASPVKELSVAIEPQQSGSGDPSPTNVRPITGVTGCEVIRSGKNLFGGIKFAEDFSDRYNGVTVDTENKTFSFAYNITQRVNQPIPLNFRFKENTSYTFIFTLKNTSIARPNMRIYYSGGTYENIPDLSGVNVKQTIVVHTSPNKTVGSIINRSQGGTTVVYYDECGMFEGNVTASDFTPYQGTTYPISWQTEAGTVYGGTVTINEDGSADVVVDKIAVDLETLTWTVKATETNHKSIYASLPELYVGYPRTSTNIFKAIAEQYIASDGVYYSGSNDGKIVHPDNYSVGYMYFSTSAIHNRGTIYLIIGVNDTPSGKLVYNPAEPITYHLASITQITTLAGENNIWADVNGTITLTYKSDGRDSDIVGTGKADFMKLLS